MKRSRFIGHWEGGRRQAPGARCQLAGGGCRVPGGGCGSSLVTRHFPYSALRTPHSALRTPRAAFTLIEVTLAAVVVGLGLLALVGLGRLALSSAREAEEDTRAALFADDIFATLRTASESLCATGAPSAWAAFWADFAAGRQPLPVLPSAASCFSNAFDSTVWGDGRICTNYLFARQENRGLTGAAEIPEWSTRCWLDVALTNAFAAPPGATNVARVTLHLVPGARGEMSESRTFYTHFAEHGSLP